MAWSRIKLKSLATEEYQERDANLFGPGFLEKASKRTPHKRYFQGEQGSKPNRIFSANKKPGQKEKSEQ